MFFQLNVIMEEKRTMTRTEKDRLEEENRELNRNQMAEKNLWKNA